MEVEDDEITNLLSKEETVNIDKTTNYRRLITGGIVLVFVDLLWVGSAELSDVCIHRNCSINKIVFILEC